MNKTDSLIEGQEVIDENGETYVVLRYIPVPYVVLRNKITDNLISGTVDSAVFVGFGFHDDNQKQKLSCP